MKPTKELVRYSCLVSLFLAACMVLVQISVAQAEQAKIQVKVQESIHSVDVDRIVKDALERSQQALEMQNLHEEIDRAMAGVDIDKIIADALAASEDALRAIDIQKEVLEALEGIDIDRIVEDALREAGKAKKELEEDKSEPL